MSATAAEFWGARAVEYDSLIRRTVPRYEELTQRLVEAVPDTAVDILELGCGTGNLSLRLARELPDARFTFVDAAAEMTEVTRARLTEALPDTAGRARFVVASFEELPAEPDAYDAVVAMISLHHVADLAPVYERLGRSLKPGGRLVNADGLRADEDVLHEAHMARWRSFWRQPGNLSPAEQTEVAAHVAHHDHYRTLTDHFAWLRAAGLEQPDCLWRDGIFALVVARR